MTSTATRTRKKSTRTERERPPRRAYKVGKVTDLLREMNDTAFRLAKDGNRNGVFQLRGAFSGTLQAAQTADGFLSGLVSILD